MLITIPDPSLVVLCGPAGSGKSTFAARHFLETAVVSSDRCRAMIADDERNIAVSPDAFELFHFIIDLRLRWRRLVVADSTAVRREARHELLRLARRHKVPALLTVFDVPVDVAYEWDGRRPRRVGRSVIQHQWERLQESLKTIHDEGFDQVYVLGPNEIVSTRVRLAAKSEAGREAPSVEGETQGEA